MGGFSSDGYDVMLSMIRLPERFCPQIGLYLTDPRMTNYQYWLASPIEQVEIILVTT